MSHAESKPAGPDADLHREIHAVPDVLESHLSKLTPSSEQTQLMDLLVRMRLTVKQAFAHRRKTAAADRRGPAGRTCADQ